MNRPIGTFIVRRGDDHRTDLSLADWLREVFAGVPIFGIRVRLRDRVHVRVFLVDRDLKGCGTMVVADD